MERLSLVFGIHWDIEVIMKDTSKNGSKTE